MAVCRGNRRRRRRCLTLAILFCKATLALTRTLHLAMSHLPSFSLQLALLCLIAAALVAYLAKTKRIFRNASSSSSSSSWLNIISGTLSRKSKRRSPLLDIPGPPALPVIGAKWCFWPSVGKYGHLQGKTQTEHWKGKIREVKATTG